MKVSRTNELSSNEVSINTKFEIFLREQEWIAFRRGQEATHSGILWFVERLRKSKTRDTLTKEIKRRIKLLEKDKK